MSFQERLNETALDSPNPMQRLGKALSVPPSIPFPRPSAFSLAFLHKFLAQYMSCSTLELCDGIYNFLFVPRDTGDCIEERGLIRRDCRRVAPVALPMLYHIFYTLY